MTDNNKSKEIINLIDKHGGCSAFARKCDIPLRTVQNWYYEGIVPKDITISGIKAILG